MRLNLESLSNVLMALAETARLRLLALCQHGELTVKELTESTGMSQPRVSRHLRILVEAGILERFRESHWVYYRLSLEGEAASLAREALARVSKQAAALQDDARRLDSVLAARARELRAAASGSDGTGVSMSAASWSNVEQAVKRMAGLALGADGLGDLLDVGTGAGRMLRLLGADARRAEGVDTSEEMRYTARTALREAGLAHCSIREGNMYGLPYSDSHFDTVLCGQVLTCADEPWKVVNEAVRVLRLDGHLLVMELLPNGVPVEAWYRSLSDWLAKSGLATVAEESLALSGATAVLNLSRRELQMQAAVDLAIA